MQYVEHWPTGPSLEPQWRVRVNDQTIEVSDVSIGRDMAFGLPAQVVGGLGITPATGTITWTTADRLVTQRESPWDPRLPNKGDTITVEAGYNGLFARILIGRVLSASGGTDSPVQVKVIDAFDRLRRRVVFPPLMSTGPRMDVHVESDNFVSPGLTATYFLSEAAAQCGYHAVPAMMPQAVMYAAMNGSALPTRGTLITSERWNATPSNPLPSWSPAPWGQGIDDIRANYTPERLSPTDGYVTAGRPLKISFVRGAKGNEDSEASSWVTARWGDPHVRLFVSPGGSASLIVGTETNFDQSPGVLLRQDDIIVAEYRHDSSYRLRTSGGVDISGQFSSRSVFNNQLMTQVDLRVQPGGSQLGGAQVWFGPQWDPLDFVRTAHLDHTSYQGVLTGTRSIDTTAIDLITEIGDAEMGAAWLDAEGHLWFRNRQDLVSQQPVRTLTSLDDLFSYSWEVPTDSVKHRTSVEWTPVALERSTGSSLTLWQGSGETLEPGPPNETIVGPGADEEWVAVDTGFMTPWGDHGKWPDEFMRGRGSWQFGTKYGEENEDGDLEEEYVVVSTPLEQLGPRAWKISRSVDEETRQIVPSHPTNYNLRPLPEQFHGEKLPILRGKGRLYFHKEIDSSTLTGPAWAETYEHDAGQWVQSRANAIRLANDLQAWMVEPLVIIRGIRIHPDPRLELGDTVIIVDGHAYDRRIQALITSIDISGSAGQMAMELGVQVISSEGIPKEEPIWAH